MQNSSPLNQLMGVPTFILFALFLFQAIDAKNTCPFRFCGSNPIIIRFPFRIIAQQPQSCGYPGFDLSCLSQKPEVAVLSLPNNGDFWVRDINYLMQEIKLYDPDGCLPKRLLSLNLSSSPFMAGYSKNFTFLSCPPDLVEAHFAIVGCLSNSSSRVLATPSMNLARGLKNCSIFATLPIPLSWPQDDDDWLSSDLSGDLRLTWEFPNCEGCEARGGICGLDNGPSGQSLCFTDPGGGQSRGLKIFKIIALSVVIPAITCSICISCFMCTVERRASRNSSRALPPPQPQPPRTITVAAGLDESTIESYTKVVLGESRRLPGPNGATCPICLVDYHPREILRCIPECDHCFHSECIDEWLRLNGTCPLCRNSPSPARPDT